jgi:hypothetical protein
MSSSLELSLVAPVSALYLVCKKVGKFTPDLTLVKGFASSDFSLPVSVSLFVSIYLNLKLLSLRVSLGRGSPFRDLMKLWSMLCCIIMFGDIFRI